jgi:hypothetical protein
VGIDREQEEERRGEERREEILEEWRRKGNCVIPLSISIHLMYHIISYDVT